MVFSLASARLADALAQLNDRQREAVLHMGDVVVVAGPGSGKTRVLAVRAAHLLAESVRRRSALAAITFTNAAADEMQERVERLGLARSRRLSIGTAHAFCLNEILLNHRPLLPTSMPQDITILSESAARRLESTILREHGLGDDFDARLELTRVRREIATTAAAARADEPFETAAHSFAQALHARGALDFEEVIIRALEAVRDPVILKLLANRFTHLLVDEYQDLGMLLHSIVEKLHGAGSEITAVGDPNQSVLGFTGASPRHLRELTEHPDFHTVHLDLNYRSAASLVSAAAGLMASTTPSQRHVRDVEGVIHHIRVDGDQWAHANSAVSTVQDRLIAGVAPGEVALLYPRKGQFLTELLAELDRREVHYYHDRADVVPKGPLARWISRCALRSLMVDTPGADLEVHLTIPALAYELAKLSSNKTREFRRSCGRQLVGFFRAWEGGDDVEAKEFAAALGEAVGMEDLMEDLSDGTDREDFDRLLELTGVSVSALASSITPTAVTVTTYQSAKGREFDVVVMPGLVEGAVPLWAPTGPPDWERLPPDEDAVAEERRAFYVAVTRARNELYLISGSGWTNRAGYWELGQAGPSRYVTELLEHVE